MPEAHVAIADRQARATRRGFGLLLLATALVMSVGAIVLADGTTGTVLTGVAIIGATGLAILAVADLAARRRARTGAIGLQLGFGVGGGLLIAVVTAWLVAALGGDEAPDLVILGSMLVTVAVLVTWTAYVLGMAVGTDVDRVSGGLMAVGEGARDVRFDVIGAGQVAHLADAGHRMVEQLMLREAERDEAEATRDALVRAMVSQLREREAERSAAEEQRKGLFVGVSHDLRTPLTALQLLVSAVRDDVATPEERATYTEQMLAQISTLTQLTEQVFELSRLEAGDMGGTRVRMSIGTLIRETVAQTSPSAATLDVGLVAEVPDALPSVDVAPTRIARVLLNLVHNALMHTPPGGRVRVAATGTPEGIEVDVSDTGSGVAAEDRSRVFEAFYRGGADAARSEPGTGLGLAISRAIVEAHGGRIWLADSDVGTTVRFVLPRADDRGPEQ
jgi:signal transduction histidine kinase